MKKPSDRPITFGTGSEAPTFAWGLCAAVRAFLTDETWDDGSKRALGTIMVMFEDGRFKAWVNDKSSGRSAWVSASTLSELFLTLDEGISTDTLDWRRARPERARGR